MSLKYEIVKRAVGAVGLKNRGKMTADEIIAFKKKQNAKIRMKSLKKLEFTGGSCFTFRGNDIPYFSYGMSAKECRRAAKCDAKAAQLQSVQ